jgi:hypothetical protein
VRDPYESKKVVVCTSAIDGANEGLFAKVDIEVNTTRSFYNGSQARPEDYDPDTWETNNYKIFDPVDMPDGTIDIPVWAQVIYDIYMSRKYVKCLYCSHIVPIVPPSPKRPTTAFCQMGSLLCLTILSMGWYLALLLLQIYSTDRRSGTETQREYSSGYF